MIHVSNRIPRGSSSRRIISPCVVTFAGEANGNSRGEINSGWLVCRAPSASCLSPLCSFAYAALLVQTPRGPRFLRSSRGLFPLSFGCCRTLQRRGRQNEFMFVVALVFVETFVKPEPVSLWRPIARNTRLILRPSECPVPFSSGVEIRFRSRGPGSFASIRPTGIRIPSSRECLTSFRQFLLRQCSW